jgi:hypothetical protein
MQSYVPPVIPNPVQKYITIPRINVGKVRGATNNPTIASIGGTVNIMV